MARNHPSLGVSDSDGARRSVAVLATLLLVASLVVPVSTTAAVGLGDRTPVVGAAGNADETTVGNDDSTTVGTDDSTTTAGNDDSTTIAGNDEEVTIRGHVTDADGDPAANDTLTLGSADRNRTDERGRYLVRGETNRSYELTYRQPTDSTDSTNSTDNTDSTNNTDRTNSTDNTDSDRDGRPAIYAIGQVNASTDRTRNVSLPSASVLNVTVVAENGTAVPNATVRVTHANEGANATLVGRTDAQGRLRIGGQVGVELAGNVTVAVDAPNSSMSDREVRVPADAGDEEVRLELIEETPPTLRYDVSTRTANASELVTFDASNSTDSSGIVATTWRFPANTVSREEVGYRFAERGNYSVNLSVTDGAGNVNRTTVAVEVVDHRDPVADLAGNATNVSVNESVVFDATNSSDSETGIAEYRWDFDGDGTPDQNTTGPRISHTYDDSGTYDATVVVVDAAGNRANASRRIGVRVPPPTANFTVSDARPSIGETVQFNASATTAVGNVTEYDWEIEYPTYTLVLGGPVIERNFSDSGAYNVTLTVTDGEEQRDQRTRTVVVPNKPPEADARGGGPGVAGTRLALDGSYSIDPDDDFSVAWTQTAGPTVELSNSSAVAPTFVAPAVNRTTTLRFALNVTDDHGLTDRDSAEVVVVPNALPNVSVAPTAPTVNESVVFRTNRSGEYDWDFDGDGTVEATPQSANVTGGNATHRFDAPGEYNVTLVDAAGRAVVRTVTVAPANESGTGETGANGTGAGETGANETETGENATETPENTTATPGGGSGGATGGGSTGGSTGGGGAPSSAGGGGTGGGATGGSAASGGTAGGGGTDGSATGEGTDADDSKAVGDTVSPTVTVQRAGNGSDRIVAAVENAGAGDRTAVEFPEEFGRNRSAFEAISVVTEGASNFSLSVATLSAPPSEMPSPGAKGVLSYLRVEERNITDAAIGSARFQFRVAAGALDDEGLSPESVRLYRFHAGEWEALPTDLLGSDGGQYRFRALSPGFSMFAVGIGSVDKSAESTTGTTSSGTEGANRTETSGGSDGSAGTTTAAGDGSGSSGTGDSTLFVGLFVVALLAAALWGYLLG